MTPPFPPDFPPNFPPELIEQIASWIDNLEHLSSFRLTCMRIANATRHTLARYFKNLIIDVRGQGGSADPFPFTQERQFAVAVRTMDIQCEDDRTYGSTDFDPANSFGQFSVIPPQVSSTRTKILAVPFERLQNLGVLTFLPHDLCEKTINITVAFDATLLAILRGGIRIQQLRMRDSTDTSSRPGITHVNTLLSLGPTLIHLRILDLGFVEAFLDDDSEERNVLAHVGLIQEFAACAALMPNLMDLRLRNVGDSQRSFHSKALMFKAFAKGSALPLLQRLFLDSFRLDIEDFKAFIERRHRTLVVIHLEDITFWDFDFEPMPVQPTDVRQLLGVMRDRLRLRKLYIYTLRHGPFDVVFSGDSHLYMDDGDFEKGFVTVWRNTVELRAEGEHEVQECLKHEMIKAHFKRIPTPP